MSDIVKRLRDGLYDLPASEVELEAAAEIERLRAEVARLKSDLADAARAEDGMRKAAGFMRVERDNARAEVECLHPDAERLRFLAAGPSPDTDPHPYLCDDFAGVDLYEEASIYASAFGREEPNADDYVAAFRTAIDAARAKEGR